MFANVMFTNCSALLVRTLFESLTNNASRKNKHEERFFSEELGQTENNIFKQMSCANPEGGGGGQGVLTTPEKSQNVEFLSNTGPDPLKIT